MSSRETSVPGPVDPGLQPERTELAWRRTALAIAIGSLVSLRIFPLVLPAAAAGWGAVPGAIGLVAACALWFGARRRQLRTTAWLRTTTPGAARDPAAGPPGAGMLLALTVLACGFGAVSLAIVAVTSVIAAGS